MGAVVVDEAQFLYQQQHQQTLKRVLLTTVIRMTNKFEAYNDDDDHGPASLLRLVSKMHRPPATRPATAAPSMNTDCKGIIVASAIWRRHENVEERGEIIDESNLYYYAASRFAERQTVIL